jgi:hypothetical protein
MMAAEEGQVDFPADCLEAMQDQFMVLRRCPPVNWASKLQASGINDPDCSTVIRYFPWLQDKEHLALRI